MKSCRKKRHKISRESVYLFGMEASVNNFYLSTGIFISRVIILDNSKHCHPPYILNCQCLVFVAPGGTS